MSRNSGVTHVNFLSEEDEEKATQNFYENRAKDYKIMLEVLYDLGDCVDLEEAKKKASEVAASRYCEEVKRRWIEYENNKEKKDGSK